MKLTNISTEEQFNTISHAVGALLAMVGMVLLLFQNNQKSSYAIYSIVLYGSTLVLMFLVSTIYHLASKQDLKQKLRILDHINIYYLIAGTYSPVALITLVHGNGWLIFFTVWTIAFLGTLLKLFFTGKYEILSLVLYLLMGWLIVLDFQSLLDHLTDVGILFLIAGGIFYTVGIIFYAVKKIPYNHFIWHLFVLAGAASHWFLIYLDVV